MSAPEEPMERRPDLAARRSRVIGRFWAKVEKGDDCWLWTACKDRDGYGKFDFAGTTVRAHRLAYELCIGPIPTGLQLDHLCRTPGCVNPAHLEPVTNRVNTLRGEAGEAHAARQHAKTHCPQGHPYDEANTYVHGQQRHCRACGREASNRYKRRRRTASEGDHR